MLKHYYVSPKKRSKSQSSEASDTSDTVPATDDCLSDFLKNHARKTCHNFHEKTSSEPNVSIAASPIHYTQTTTSFGENPLHGNERLHTFDISTSQKKFESRLSRIRLAHAFNNAVTYSRSRLAHLPTGASICVGHVYGSILNAAHTDNPNSIGLTPPVRRWNSFHSTRGECHPNKFRRERKSTSPSIV